MALVGFLMAIVVVVARITSGVSVQGWASVWQPSFWIGGAMLFALGVIAEYVGVSVRMAMGKPLYLVICDPAQGPLHRERSKSFTGSMSRSPGSWAQVDCSGQA